MSLPAVPVAALAAPPGKVAASSPPGYTALCREMRRHAAGARGRLLLAFALLVGSQVAKLGLPWLAAQPIDHLQQGGGVAAALPWFGAGVRRLA